ncbi:MAG: glycoside hydrolase family 95 protein [Lachnospiraceae bacterium]|nr:glycoside hydrolase family 95 protein [Lachnospiraceae bacterium]
MIKIETHVGTGTGAHAFLLSGNREEGEKNVGGIGKRKKSTMSKLWYNTWAKEWNEALPIGNGRIGGMVYADPLEDEIYLNEETLWSGFPCGAPYARSTEQLNEIREMIRNKEYDRSDPAILGLTGRQGSQMYLSLGRLLIRTDNFKNDGVEYRRELDLKEAVVRSYCSTYDANFAYPITYEREYFTSLADDVLAMRVKTNYDWFCATIALDMHLDYERMDTEGKSIFVEGRCPTDYRPDDPEHLLEIAPDKESVPFCAEIRVESDGRVYRIGKRLKVERASYVTLICSIATGFDGFDKQPISEGRPYRKLCKERMERALQYGFDDLRKRHVQAYKKQYDRMEICLDGADYEDIPTDERIRLAAEGREDNKLTQLLFDYGRYLLICSSQENGQPANLQGIWTKDVPAPWRCNYTVNINTQMNYWAAEQVDLPECHMPLMRMIKEISTRGNYYGLQGWSCGHNTDLWRFNSETGGSVCCGAWQMGGIWLARHIYEHYMFTRDEEFLKEYYGVLEGIYDFLSGWLIRDENGLLTTSPSTSPENAFLYRGIKASAAEGSAMDLSIIADYLDNMIELTKVLNRDASRYEKMRSELKPLRIGSDGRILEYGEEFEEAEPGHRHVSHLFGLHPACTIKEGDALYDAAKKTLEYRLAHGGGHTGWSNAWIANMYARLKDGEKANGHILTMFRKSIYPNMLDAHPPFQIDGNFGICAAICEMLVQSHGGKTVLLPAIPAAWKSGYVKGMKTREGKKISFRWEGNTVYDYRERE